MKTHNSIDERFEFGGKAKTWSLIAILVGIIAVAFGFLVGQGERTFANLLLMSYYFVGVCIAGAVFCGIQYVAQAGWSASILRIPQAFARVLPIAGIILIVVIFAGMHLTHQGANEEGKTTVLPYLYKLWAVHGVATPGSENYDAIIAAKSGFLNQPFFFARLVILLGTYSLFAWLLIKYSQNEDEIGGMSNYRKSFTVSCAFLAIFGFTQPILSFDAIMSLEAHWFSTMFGWYNFAAMWVSGLAVMTLVMIYLRQNGYLSWLTQDHLHNMGLFMFAFSVFWTYVWFAQFLLQYYANIPEESVYFYKRWEPEFKPWFWLNVIMNFASPLLILMSRDSKRQVPVLKWIACILIVGHWLDYYMMIMPGTVGSEGRGFGVEEIGIFIGFAGLGAFFILSSLSKFKSLIPKKHPFLAESLHHHI
jgi:hypothetical protein